MCEFVSRTSLVTFVEFSSPWCIWAHPNTNGHGDCATMRVAWDKLGETYNFSHAISVAEVDCSRFVTHPPDEDGTMRSRESLCQRFNIRSYPTVMIFTGETGTSGANYTGGQTYDAMHKFLEKEREKLCLLDPMKGMLEPGPMCGEDEQKFLAQWREKTPDEALTELMRLENIVSNREVCSTSTSARCLPLMLTRIVACGAMQINFGASKRAWLGRRINLLKQIRVVHRPALELKTEL